MFGVGAEQMPVEDEDEEGEMGSENGEISSKQKYRALKRRLKYLAYEHECFESDVQKSQTKLLQLARDKSFLLDQLMRYEAVVISDDDETDYSSTEEEGMAIGSTAALSTQVPPVPSPLPKQDLSVRSQASGKSSLIPRGPPNVVVGALPPKLSLSKSAAAILTVPAVTASAGAGAGKTLTVTKATGGTRSTKKVTKAGGGKKLSATTTARITKTVAKARGQPAVVSVTEQLTSPLIVSVPLNVKAGAQNTKQQQHSLLPLPDKAIPLPTQPPPHPLLPSTDTVPPSSSSSSSSESSTTSGSEDTGSQSSSSSSSSSEDDEEPMDVGGPVPMVSKVTSMPSSTPLIRPKAITSPVKVPPQLIQVVGGGSSASSSLVRSPLLSPSTSTHLGGFLWSNRPVDASFGSSSQTEGGGGFIPLVPPLSSPPSASSIGIGKPSAGSAFQIVSPKPHHLDTSKHSTM